MIPVQNILDRKKKSFNIIQPTALVIDALTMLNSVNLSYLIVMDDDQFKGIFSERDYCRNVILKGRSSKTTTVQEVMTTDIPIIDVAESAEYCMSTLNLHKTRYVIAFDKSRFAGVVTIHDLLRQVLINRENVFDEVLAEKLIAQEEGEKVF
ncbi:MAG: CBS domain-containing protein [Chitinophagaceae bacterium]|nr:CBS domain-containing protein [Chitinophagaceae bacterium]